MLAKQGNSQDTVWLKLFLFLLSNMLAKQGQGQEMTKMIFSYNRYPLHKLSNSYCLNRAIRRKGFLWIPNPNPILMFMNHDESLHARNPFFSLVPWLLSFSVALLKTKLKNAFSSLGKNFQVID